MKIFNTLILTLGFLTSILNAAQYDKPAVNQTPFFKSAEYNSTYYNTYSNSSFKTNQNNNYPAKSKSTQKQLTNSTNNKKLQNQQNNSTTKIRQLPQPTRYLKTQSQPEPQPKNQVQSKTQSQQQSDFKEVQFSGELFDMSILNSDDTNTSTILPKQIPKIITKHDTITTPITATDDTAIKPPLKLIAPIKPNHVSSVSSEVFNYSDEYPDPRRIGTIPYSRGGIAPVPYNSDRYGAIPEEEVHRRFHIDESGKQLGQPSAAVSECPLCKDDPKTPCGECEKCKLGYRCERTVCSHCVQPLSRDMNNFCDLTAGNEPCGTCDSCREHRSDPCGHADDGRGPHGEWNPYKQSRIFAVIPRPILDEYNNGARKFPVYYNPAPYYRHYWNPSLYTGYARPYTFRYTCPVCSDGVCKCDKPPFAGQVPFSYTCKFCNRNPCACAEDICDANAEMQPSGRSSAIENARSKSTRIQDTNNPGISQNQNQNQSQNQSQSQNENKSLETNTDSTQPIPNLSNGNNNEQSLSDLLDEKAPTTPNNAVPRVPRSQGKRQLLDGPKIKSPNTVPRTGVIN